MSRGEGRVKHAALQIPLEDLVFAVYKPWFSFFFQHLIGLKSISAWIHPKRERYSNIHVYCTNYYLYIYSFIMVMLKNNYRNWPVKRPPPLDRNFYQKKGVGAYPSNGRLREHYWQKQSKTNKAFSILKKL